MALKDAILVALADGESSGYDLAKSFDVAVANFWSATPQQLYRELDKMESQGLVQARLIQQERRPNKRLFSLTDIGRHALQDFTRHPPKPTAIRDELLVQVAAMELGDMANVRANVEHHLAAAEKKLKRYERARLYLLDGQSEPAYLATRSRLGPYLTLRRGIAFEEENIRWAGFVITVLESRG